MTSFKNKTATIVISKLCLYIKICCNANNATIKCFITTKRARTTRMYCLLSSMATKLEKRVITYFHDDRSIQEIPHDFALEMGLGPCIQDFALHMGKSQLPCTLYANGLLRLKKSGLCLQIGTCSHG